MLRDQREPGWMQVPNDFVDLVAPQVGARGVWVYLLTLRAVTTRHYPSVADIAFTARLPQALVATLLYRLWVHGALNDHDLDNISGYEHPAAEEVPPVPKG